MHLYYRFLYVWPKKVTDGLATRKPRHTNNNDDDDDKHPYLEDHQGIPVN
jgi:hypothetical protein